MAAGTYEVLDLALTRTDATLIAPMTLVDIGYFDEIVGRLRACGHDVRHFALLAERDTVLRRLRERAAGRPLQMVLSTAPVRRTSFAVANLDRCLGALRQPQFAQHLWTDDLSVRQVADQIAVSAGLTLRPNTDNALQGYLRRAWTGIRHIRFD